MVNISSPIDGQAFAIEGQEGQDPDEPPIPRLPSQESTKQNGNVSALPTLGSFGSTSTAWDGNPNTAHTIDAVDVAAYLEVLPL